MPDFAIIEGGGERTDWDREIAQQHFEDFVSVLLRSLANGNGTHRLTQDFFHFLEHTQKTGVPIGRALARLHGAAFGTGEDDDYIDENKFVTLAALRVVVESIATDGLAQARLSKREDGLEAAIEAKVLGSERRAREHGWSYLANLTEHLGKWPPRGGQR